MSGTVNSVTVELVSNVMIDVHQLFFQLQVMYFQIKLSSIYNLQQFLSISLAVKAALCSLVFGLALLAFHLFTDIHTIQFENALVETVYGSLST